MDYRDFEKHLAHQLNVHELPLDTEAFIEQLHGKKSRRKLWWLWMIIPTLVASGLYGLFFVQEQGAMDVRHQEKVLEKPIAPQQIVEAAEPMVIDLNPTDMVANTMNSPTLPSPGETKNMGTLSEFNQQSTKIQSQKHEVTTQNVIQNMPEAWQNAGIQQGIPIEDQVEAEVGGQNIADNQIRYSTLSPLTSTLSGLAIDRQLPYPGDKIICPDFSTRTKMNFELIPEIGVFLPIKNLEIISSDPVTTSKRKDLEKSLEGISAALYGKISHRKFPLYLKAGVSWSKLTEKTVLDYSYITRDTTKGIISVTYSQTGDTITAIIGDIVSERKFSGSKTRHYALKMWDIPVMIGYEKQWNQWIVGAELCAVINLSLEAEGHMLQTDSSFIDVKNPNQLFHSKLGLSYTGGLFIGRNLNPWSRIYLTARMRYLPDSFNVPSADYKQQYQFVGLYAGYSIVF